jgi:hypothetical protein
MPWPKNQFFENIQQPTFNAERPMVVPARTLDVGGWMLENMTRRATFWILIGTASLLFAIFVIHDRWSGPPDQAGLRRAEIWLRDVRDIAGRDHRWDFIRWYSYSKVGYAYVVFEGGVETDGALGAFRQAVEDSGPPVPLCWNVRVLTNGFSQLR